MARVAGDSDSLEMVAVGKYPLLQEGKRRRKTPKGMVKVEDYRGLLRLRWSHQGKRYSLAMGLPVSKVNLVVAEQKARQIENDLATGNYDPTRKKYMSDTQRATLRVSVVKLFEQFIDQKGKSVTPKTLEKYHATLGYLQRFYNDTSAAAIGDKEAELFADSLKESGLSADQQKRRLEELAACWTFGLETDAYELKSNPWIKLKKRVKVPPRQKPKPFTQEEIDRIIEGFRSDPGYAHHLDYVTFLFFTGCRTGEAIGLRWKHLNHDCSVVWFGEIITRGVERPAKSNKSRENLLDPAIQKMLLARRPSNYDPEGLVFVGPRGAALDDHNFRNRLWVPMLERLGIPYRKPYSTRHTFGSHEIEQGANPLLVAETLGHDVKTFFKDYAGSIKKGRLNNSSKE